MNIYFYKNKLTNAPEAKWIKHRASTSAFAGSNPAWGAIMDDFIVLNKKEVILLRDRLHYHNWSDMQVSYNGFEKFLEKFKLTETEFEQFRHKLKI